MLAQFINSEPRKGTQKLTHIAYSGVICHACGYTANVPYETKWWQCPSCHFFNKVIMRLPLFEEPKAGPSPHQTAEEFLEDTS